MKKNILVASSLVLGLALGAQTVSADTVTVQAGDTVSEIAHEYEVPVSNIVNANSLSNQNLIFIGDKLQVNGNASTANQTAKVSVQVPTVKTEQPERGQTQPTVTGNKTVNYSSAESQTQSVQPQQSSQSSQSSQSQQSKQSPTMSKTSGQLSQSEINQVAEEMASRTGQPSSTWSTIINRESKGNVDISNSEGSGAYGLLQLMRSSHSSVSSQVDEAVQLYEAQRMSAWSQTAY